MHMRPVGYVYILTNPAMPGLVKVGMTERHSTRERIAELSTHTGVPEEFELAYRAQVFDAYATEQRAHALLIDKCPKKKEFFQCDVLAAVSAVRIAAGHDLIAEESHVVTSIEELSDVQLRVERTRLDLLAPRGRSVTGLSQVPFERQRKSLQEKMAWSIYSPTYGYVFYGSGVTNTKRLLEAVQRDFPEVSDFQKAGVLLDTAAGRVVRQRQIIQEECDRDNAAIRERDYSTSPQHGISRGLTAKEKLAVEKWKADWNAKLRREEQARDAYLQAEANKFKEKISARKELGKTEGLRRTEDRLALRTWYNLPRHPVRGEGLCDFPECDSVPLRKLGENSYCLDHAPRCSVSGCGNQALLEVSEKRYCKRHNPSAPAASGTEETRNLRSTIVLATDAALMLKARLIALGCSFDGAFAILPNGERRYIASSFDLEDIFEGLNES